MEETGKRSNSSEENPTNAQSINIVAEICTASKRVLIKDLVLNKDLFGILGP